MFRWLLCCVCFWCLLDAFSPSVFAQRVDYVRDVRPILQQHCYRCHGEQRQRSGLRLDIKSEAFKGGDGWGESLIAGDPEESPLMQLVTADDRDMRMPPGKDGLPPEAIAVLRRWIAEGAHWPDGVDLAELEDRMDHWSFKPLVVTSPPAVATADWARGPIDRFVLAGLEQTGLSPSAPAEPLAWLRRVSIDLTGLPPTPDEARRFLERVATSPTAYEEAVDRLLASPRYGERWAQHWLDLVRYADTHGFEVNTERPNAWPYRDYVIEALNSDTPYDRFVREQIVGDAFDQDPATGFLVTASVLLPGQIGKDEASKRLARQDALDEIVNNVSQTFMGLSVGCARCHDHKFDPISARDYYSMQAFVAGVEYKERRVETGDAEERRRRAAELRERIAAIDQRLSDHVPLARPQTHAAGRTTSAKLDRESFPPQEARRTAVDALLNIDRFAPVTTDRVRFVVAATNTLEPCIDELEVFNVQGENVAAAERGTGLMVSGETMVANRHEAHFVHDGRYGNERSWLSNQDGAGTIELQFADLQTIDRVVWSRDRNGQFHDRLATDYHIEALVDGVWRRVADAGDRHGYDADAAPTRLADELRLSGLSDEGRRQVERQRKEKQSLEKAAAEAEQGPVAFAGRFRTPDPIHLLSRGDPEQPRDRVPPAVLSRFGEQTLAPDCDEQTRRLALADWIVRPDHPLTSRVLVNRIWQWHFGIGFVDTPNDFGRNGSRPSHPELLDYLADQFIRSGWSLKQLHRRIVLSSTYRQSAQHNAFAAQRDADVRLLWRFPRRRVEAEVIRDTMVAVGGRLERTMGGRGFDRFNKRGGLSGFTPVESFEGEGLRRMIYAHKVRREPDAVFGAFDCPDGGQSAPRRSESTTPIQALNLFNSTFTAEQSAALSQRLRRECGSDVDTQVARAFELVLCRSPTPTEQKEAGRLAAQHGLETMCRVLFNCNEFLFSP
ncbi:PSD1 and planctomycete cytochrome C domain-containing protein [Roseimaritima sediminicola]|uniref:PSD1 and planctomycete cytochrome C domain-containing protein n=1 Tax=Roseimaritima sediminicola TaxID=2662066 RepID=UPI00129830BE|nr:PSD1 and planctomycete cytochrome C domain-containing protein [Roseimaritima sediminicola]